MNFYSPLSLMNLTKQKLLREEFLTFSALKDLPNRLFPVMFKEAFIDGHPKILTAMISLWPFPYLSVVILIKNLNLDTLKAVLEGTDILISKMIRSSRCKLREIKWRDTDHDLCGIWAGSLEVEGLPVFMEEKQPDCGMKKKLRVMTQLQLMEGSLDEWDTHLLQRAQQRKDSIHLYCGKLKIQGLNNTTEIFKILHSDCIQHLELYHLCLEYLDFLNPYLKLMNNLLTLSLHEISYPRKLADEKLITVISQLPTFHYLQVFYVNYIPLLEGNLKESLRCLKKHLETLCITNCDLSQSDLEYLHYCLNFLSSNACTLVMQLHFI